MKRKQSYVKESSIMKQSKTSTLEGRVIIKRFRKSLLLACLTIALVIGLTPYVMATDDILPGFPLPSTWFCAGDKAYTYADVDGDPDTGFWVGSEWSPNETQIALIPIRGNMQRFSTSDGPIFFGSSGGSCGETDLQTMFLPFF